MHLVTEVEREPEHLARVIPFPNARLESMMRHPSWPRTANGPAPMVAARPELLDQGVQPRLVLVTSR